MLHVKFSSPEKPQQGQSVQSVFVAFLLQHGPQLVYLSILLLGGVARMAGLGLGGGGRKVIVVVLRI